MAADWWKRLPPARRRIYERSDAIGAIPLRPDVPLRADVGAIDQALRAADAELVAETSQKLVADICRRLGVPSVRVELRQGRPHDQRGELHGLYEAWSDKHVITMWMRTARRNDVVATRTYLRTLLHEVCHHLDFHLLHLEESFHSTGFFRRESSLVRALLPPSNRAKRRPVTAARPSAARPDTPITAVPPPSSPPRASAAAAPPSSSSAGASAESGLSLLLATLDALERRRAADRAARAREISPPRPAAPAPTASPEPRSETATAAPPQSPRRDPRTPPDR